MRGRARCLGGGRQAGRRRRGGRGRGGVVFGRGDVDEVWHDGGNDCHQVGGGAAAVKCLVVSIHES
jgi:hypothetical protein